MDVGPAWRDGVLGYPVRGGASGRRFAVGTVPFALVWFGYAWVAMLPPEGAQLPLLPREATLIPVFGVAVVPLVVPAYLVLLGYYARVLDETLHGSRELAGFGAPLALARQFALAVVSATPFVPVAIGVALGIVWVTSIPLGRPPDAVPEPVGRAALAVGGLVGLHGAVAQLVVLFAAGGRVRALRQVRRTLALVGNPALLVGTARAVVLLVGGGVAGYSLYVVAFSLGNVGGPTHGLVGSLVAPLAGAVALGAVVHYTALCAVRTLGLVAREQLDGP